jgi:anti-sigma B factor antagonist
MAGSLLNDPLSPLDMEITTEGDTTTVCLRGRLVVGQTETLEGKLKPMLPVHRSIVLDLGGLNQIDSTGLGSLVSLCLAGKQIGCQIGLKNLTKRIKDLLSLTNMLSLFGSYDEKSKGVGVA